jgi:CBS domain-containing protein
LTQTFVGLKFWGIRMAGVLMVRDIMTKAVKTVKVNANVKEVVKKMNKFNIGSIVIVEGRRPVGIITERDILRRIVDQCIDPTIVKVKEIMSHPVITTGPNISIENVARLMAKKGIKKLPVVEDDRLVGIVTSMDLMRAGPRLVDLLEDLLRIR